MKIKKVAFGDLQQSFVEDRFHDNVNIIFSDDNNKGKTLVFQGLMFSIGNEPIFPAGFLIRIAISIPCLILMEIRLNS